MGYSFTSVAVRGPTREAVLATMGLRGTNTFEEIPESDITGVALPSGWYLVIANRDVPTFSKEVALKQLSQSSEVVTCFVEEHVMCSEASFWADGQRVWSVMHSADQGIEHLKTQGNLPQMFAPIRDRLRAEQAAAGGNKAGVDYIFDVPVEMVAELTGYRHDQEMPELGKRAFEVLVTTAPTPKRSFWSRRPLFIMRLFAGFSLLAGVAVFYDLFLGSPEHDSAIVTGKSKTSGRGTSYNISAQGHFHYDEGVSQPFYNQCQNGDTLQLSLTPIFKEWRQVSLVRGGSVLRDTVGQDIFWMGGFGFAFLLTAGVSFFAPASLWQKPAPWIVVSVVDLAAVLLFLKYMAVLAKFSEKM